ncbi:MAG: ribokinase [Leptotrichiaceae bacterium]|nr:ribokinase [Leptotrichiaceae bacterium]
MSKIGVIGSLNLDTVIQVDRIPEEGENLLAKSVGNDFGGKGGNSAIALKKLDCDICFFSCLGNDSNAELIKENLHKYGIDTSDIKISSTHKTGAAYVLLEKNGNNRIIVAPGANMDIRKEDIRNIFQKKMKDCEYILIQLENSLEAVAEIIKICKEKNIKLVIDAGPVRNIKAEDLKGAYIVSPNKSELEALVNRKLETFEDIKSGAKDLLNTGIENILVKMGKNGSFFLNGKTEIYQEIYEVPVSDTTAAGDSYMAGFIKTLSEGKSIKEAMNFASACGAVTVTGIGAVSSLPSLKEVENFLKKHSLKASTLNNQ